jgi:uracil-DNA glycosylase
MDEIRRDFLDIVAQVRTQVELQRALGVRDIALTGACSGIESQQTGPTIAPAAEKTASQISVSECIPPMSLASVRTELGDCTRCKLHKGRKNIVFGEGSETARLVFVGEGPGQEEDIAGRPFVGAAGQLLTDIIVKGMKLRREDVYICNIVKCRPPDNRNPEPDEVEACISFLQKQLAALHPAVIIALGNVAAKALLATSEGITALRGKWRSYGGIALMPTFHPAYLLRNPKDKKLVWSDIQQVMKKLGIQ